jgi:hypothetical protein
MSKQQKRMMLYLVLISIGCVNVMLGVAMPAFFVYKALIRDFPFVSRPQALVWGMPWLCFSMMIGLAVFIICMIAYTKFHSQIDDAF